ncbi:MAG: hypothetical protein ACI9EV_002945 [Urechidicola sp.]|jgi:hypothetical protein
MSRAYFFFNIFLWPKNDLNATIKPLIKIVVGELRIPR